MINKEYADISLRKQCELLDLNRSTIYYENKPESQENLLLMRLLDEQYTKTPCYGVLKMTAVLRALGYEVNHKRVRRLLRLMGLEAIYQKPRLSDPCPGHKIYPYLLRGVVIDRCDHVWSTDITYIRLNGGFVYLMAVIDWYSRYVLGWSLSTSLEANFCIETVESLVNSGRCEIFNTDQGSQFTSARFTEILLNQGIKVSMDGRGRALDNIFVERLWRTVKYEFVYLQDLHTVQDARDGFKNFFNFYNHERLHQSLGYKTPAQIYLGR